MAEIQEQIVRLRERLDIMAELAARGGAEGYLRSTMRIIAEGYQKETAALLGLCDLTPEQRKYVRAIEIDAALLEAEASPT